LKTDQLVLITEIEEGASQFGVPGSYFTLDHSVRCFMPKSLELRNARWNHAKKNQEARVIAAIDQSWIDLRAAYACTVNKSQGSTYLTFRRSPDAFARNFPVVREGQGSRGTSRSMRRSVCSSHSRMRCLARR
jgi:hypothetical protein